MRRIIFRGKKVDTDQWVFGDLRQTGSYNTIIDKSGNGWGVKSETVGQFTGLIDVNGKEIFEGDIIRNATPSIQREFTGPVEWSVLFNSWIVNSYMPLYGNVETYEIVGNIHDSEEEDSSGKV